MSKTSNADAAAAAIEILMAGDRGHDYEQAAIQLLMTLARKADQIEAILPHTEQQT